MASRNRQPHYCRAVAKPRAINEETAADVIDRYNRGEKLADITAATGVPRPTIYYLLRRAGVQPSRQTAADKPKAGEVEGTLRWAMGRIAELEREAGELHAELRILRAAVAARESRDDQ